MKIINFLFIINLFLYKSVQLICNDIKITIFIHGTKGFSRLSLKYSKENNKIINVKNISQSYLISIANLLSEIDPKNFSQNHFYAFRWSGKLDNNARKEAAKILFYQINDLIYNLKKENSNPTISIITHSHGGNVALNLANYITENALDFYIERLILLACPVQNQTSSFINHKIFKKVYSLYSIVDLTQILDPQGFHKENKNKKVPFFSEREFKPANNLKQARIRINNRGLCHTEFITTKFFQHLPTLLNKLDELPTNSVKSLVKV